MSKKIKTCILIAGMHRCGTSAVAGSFELLGYNTGKTMMPPTPDNPKGYFENIKCWRLNEKLLSMLYLSWDSTAEPDLKNIYIQDRIYIHEIEKIIAEDFNHSENIIIKDPRLSYLFPYWIEGLQFLNYDIKIVIPFRSPESVCRSLHERDGFSVEKSSLLYSKYLLQSIMSIQNFDYAVVDFDLFKEKPFHTLHSIVETIKADTPVDIKTIEKSIVTFVDYNSGRKSNDKLYTQLLPVFTGYTHELFKKIDYTVKSEKVQNEVNEAFATLSNILGIKSYVDDDLDSFHREQDEDDSQIDFLNELLGDLKFNYKNITKEISETIISNNLAQHKTIREELSNLKSLLAKPSMKDHIKLLNKQIDDDKAISQSIKKELAEHQQRLNIVTAQLNQIQIEYYNLKNSLSNRLGFMLTWPIRKIHTFALQTILFFKWLWSYLYLVIREKEAAKEYLTRNNLRKLLVSLKTEPSQNVYRNVERSLKEKSGVLSPNKRIQVQNQDQEPHSILCHVDEAIIKDGNVFIRGWALSKKGIEKVDFIYDDIAHPMIYKFERQDLAFAYPEYKDSGKGGFFLFADIGSGKENGVIRIYENGGFTYDIEVNINKTENLDYVVQHVDMTYLKTELQYPIWSMINKSREEKVVKLDYNPLISIVLPVFNVDAIWLNRCIDSVMNQSYSNWELCIYDDASSKAETLESLKKWKKKDSRIKLEIGTENVHISLASNRALSFSEGEFIALLDHDDELHSRALYEVVKFLNDHPNSDVIYTDEDKISESGKHIEPHFKPGWSPETLENIMYIGHLLVIRKTIMDQVGGFRKGFEGSQDFDLVLRISEVTQRFRHLPKILYHWRISDSSSAGVFENKDYAHVAAEKAIAEHLERSNKKGTVKRSKFSGLYEVIKEPNDSEICIIIPFHNQAQMTLECIESIQPSTYTNYSIILVSNNSNKEEFSKVEKGIQSYSNITLLEYNIPFNFSAINNWAVNHADSDILLFLNNDIKVINEDWLERMLEHAEQPEIGAVGAKLLYEDGSVQHAGVIMCVGGVAGHGFRNLPDEDPGYCGYASIYRNCSAVTGACLMIKKEAFLEVGGFNEEHLHVAYNDIDLCLKLLRRGYRNIYTPHAKLYHLESKTRPRTIYDMSREELIQFNYESDYMKNTYPDIFKYGDPYYNINLTVKHENYSLNI